MRRRVVQRCLRAAGAALDQGRARQAAAAIEEARLLDPSLPELPALSDRLAALRRMARRRSRTMSSLLAVGVFGVVLVAPAALHEPAHLLAYPTTAAVLLVNARLSATPGASAANRPPAERAPRPDPPSGSSAAAPQMPANRARAVSRPVPNAPPASASGAGAAPPATPAAASRPPIADPGTVAGAQASGALAPPPLEAAVAPPPVAPPVAPRVDEQVRVERTLQQYRRAYERLDARLAESVYPEVNRAALARAFDSLESQSIVFDRCDVEIRGAAATATCRGSSTYVPKIGSREPRDGARVWTFALRDDGSAWRIERARATR